MSSTRSTRIDPAKTILAAIAAALLAASAASCIIPVYMDEGSHFGGPTEAFNRTLPFKSGQELRINNAYGNIIIRGWDEENLAVTAEETWNESAGAGTGRYREGAVIPRIEIETGDSGVTITARPRDEAFAGDRVVHLFVQVPHHVLLKSVTGGQGRLSLSDLYGEARLRLENGDVRIENYSGSLDVELGRGEIQTELTDLRCEDIVRIVLNDGPITVSLDPAFGGRLEATAGSGTLICDFPVEPPAESARASGKIGTGEGALIFVTARSGDVRIRKTA